MTGRRLLFSALLGVLGVVHATAIADSGGADDGACSLSGRVLDFRTGRPVPNVLVGMGHLGKPFEDGPRMVMPYGSPEPLEAESAPDGRFVLENIKAGEFLVLTRDPLMALVQGEIRVEFAPGERKEGIRLVVAEGASVSGRVFDEEYRDGIAGEVVQVYKYTPDDEPWRRSYRAVTDSSGRFRIGGLPMADYVIGSARESAFQQTSATFLGERPMSTRYPQPPPVEPFRWNRHYELVEYTVRPRVLVRGRVIDEAGTPQGHVAVGFPWAHKYGPQAYTRADGTFALPCFNRDGPVTLFAYKDDWVSDFQRVEPGQAHPCTLILYSAPTVFVRILDVEGNPLLYPARISVDAIHEAREGRPLKSVLSDSGGACDLGPLVPGSYQISVERPTGTEAKPFVREVTLGYGERLDLTLPCMAPDSGVAACIDGRVADEAGRPVRGSTVRAGDLFATSGGDGRFHLPLRAEVLDPEQAADAASQPTVLLAITAEGYAPALERAEPGAGHMTVVLSRGMEATGRVLAARTGEPILDYSLTVRPRWPGSASGQLEAWLEDECVRIRPEGRFSLSGLPPLDCELEFDAPGFERRRVDLRYRRGKKTREKKVKLKPADCLRGQLVDLEGFPVSSAQVVARQEGMGKKTVHADPFGKFVVEGVRPLPIQISFQHRAYTWREETVVPRRGRFEETCFVMTEGGTLSILVTSGGEPLSGVGFFCDAYKTDEEGRLELDRMPAGEGVLDARFDQGSGLERGRMLTPHYLMPPDGHIDLHLDFSPGNTTLASRLTRGGQPVSGRVVITMVLPDGERILEPRQVHRDGRFLVKRLPAGQALVRGVVEGGSISRRAALVANKTTEVYLDLDEAVRLSGCVEGGPPGEGLYIRAVAGGLEPELTHRDFVDFGTYRSFGWSAVEDGKFRIDDVAPGLVSLLVGRQDAGVNRDGLDAPLPYLAIKQIEVGEEGLSGVVIDLDESED